MLICFLILMPQVRKNLNPEHLKWVLLYITVAVKGWPESRNWKWNNSRTRLGITNQLSCNRNIKNRNK